MVVVDTKDIMIHRSCAENGTSSCQAAKSKGIVTDEIA